MIDILFFVDVEEGHILPAVGIARKFQNAGLRVAFMGVPDSMAMVRSYGFETYAILAEIYPEGRFCKRLLTEQTGAAYPIKQHVHELLAGALDELFEQIKPGLIISSFFLSVEALILFYRYAIPQSIFWTFLPQEQSRTADIALSIPEQTVVACMKRISEELEPETQLALLASAINSGGSIRRFEEMAKPLAALSHLVLCAPQLLLEMPDPDPRVHYVEEGIRPVDEVLQQRLAERFVPRQIIYVSLGSQVQRYASKALRFMHMIIQTMQSQQMSRYQLVLAAGPLASTLMNGALPANVEVWPWAPQLEVLSISSLAIIHGGLGSVKECIRFGVPMIIAPMGREQLANARRVAHHNIGAILEESDWAEGRISKLVDELLNDVSTAASLEHMWTTFEDLSQQQNEFTLLKEIQVKSSAID